MELEISSVGSQQGGSFEETSSECQTSGGVGPIDLNLLHGEKVAAGVNTLIGRRGRSTVDVRVVGDASVIGWLEAAYLWGG